MPKGFHKQVENTVEKRRNCSLRAISFRAVLSRLVLQTGKIKRLFEKGLNTISIQPFFLV